MMVHRRLMQIKILPFRRPIAMMAYDISNTRFTPGQLILNPAFVEQWKLDGQRLLGVKRGSKSRLYGRSGKIYTINFPHIAAALSSLKPVNLILDGEVVYLDKHGDDLQEFSSRRMRIQDPVKREEYIKRFPVKWMVFDVLECQPLPSRFIRRLQKDGRAQEVLAKVNGANVTQMPLWARLWLLQEIMGRKRHSHMELVRSARTPGAKRALKERMRRLNREGVMHKRLDSVYREGRPSDPNKSYRSPDWIKDKFTKTDEVVIIGWYDGTGNRQGLPGGIYGAQWDGKGFRYTGKVGGGFKYEKAKEDTGVTLLELLTILKAQPQLDEPATPDIHKRHSRPIILASHWIEPKLVVEVRFRERSKNNRLIEARFLWFRPDKSAKETEYPGESLVSKRVKAVEKK